MKIMRKTAFLCAMCLSVTFCPMSVSAADDPVLAYIATMKNDKFTVDAKKLGYTALDGKIPPKPDWYNSVYYLYGPEQESPQELYGEDAWKAHVQYSLSIAEQAEADGLEPSYGISNLNGLGIIKDGKTEIPYGCEKVILINKNGDITYQAALLDGNQGEWAFDGSSNTFSVSEGLGWRGDLEGAHYVDVENGYSFSYPFGTEMYNGYAAVLESIENGKTFESVDDLYTETIDDNGYVHESDKIIKHQLSLINYKGEKVFSLSEPIQLYNGAGMNDFGFSVTGYNYWMKLGWFSEDLILFTCDRQLGATLNDLIENTDADTNEDDEDVEVHVIPDTRSNQYKFAEHECGYADLQGNIVIPQNFDSVSPFHDGIALVGVIADDSDRWNPVYQYGFIDKTGNYVVEPKYYYNSWAGSGTGSFSEGFAKVALKDESGALQYGYIDKTGAEVIPLQYEDAGDFQNGLAKVKKDGKWGYINTKGETVLPFEYTKTYGSDGTYFVVGKEVDGATKFGAIDTAGNTILPFIFEDMSNPVNGLVYAFCNKELYSFAISQGSTEPKSNTFDLRYTFNLDSSHTEQIKLSMDYNPDKFTDPTTYSPKLARTLSIIAASAYTKDDIQYNLKSMGFDRVESQNYYIDPVDDRYENDSCGFSFGEKALSNGKKLVLIAIRGSYSNGQSIGEMLKHENSDWRSNFNLTLDPSYGGITNYGFGIAMTKVHDALNDYLGTLKTDHSVIYMITGHSRGAGIGNCLAYQLNQDGIAKNDVFCYNFACPDVARELSFNPQGKFDNIFNIGVQGDIVALIPGSAGDSIGSIVTGGNKVRPWGKYGQSYWFSLDWNQEKSLKDFNNHAAENYVDHMAKEYTLNQAKNLKQLRKSTNTSLVSILVQCPVDVEVVDPSTSQVIVSIVDNEVRFNSESENDLIVMSWTEDDDKNISILGNPNYIVNLTGSDEGTMDCLVTISSADSAITDSVMYYKDVELFNGKSMVLEINEEENKHAEKIVVQKDDAHSSEFIKPTFFKPASLCGDTNLNNEISVDDAQLTLKAYTERIAGNNMKLTAEQIMAADVNCDGEISVDDAQNILIYYVNNTVAGKVLTWDELLG